MTTIGTITVNTPYRYSRNGYNVILNSIVDEARFTQMRELFAKAEYGTAVHQIPGERPYGEDLSADSVNTVYCTWTQGTSGKVPNGWYLLRSSFSYIEDESPEGNSYVYTIGLFFIGTDAYYQAAYGVIDLDVLDSDWGI